MEQLIKLYKSMYDLTEPECRLSCRMPQRCCSPEYCEATIEFAAEEWNMKLERTDHLKLPLMGPSGCTAPPHVRPMCTFHTCDVNGLGFKRNDPDGEWNKKYFELREEIETLEYSRVKITPT
jgi:hypothetical protein